MKKFLVIGLAIVTAMSMSMTAYAAKSPGSGSSSHHSSSSSSSSSKSSGGGSAAKPAASSADSAAKAAQAKANAAVKATYAPAQAVVTSDGKTVPTSVTVSAAPSQMQSAWSNVAPAFGAKTVTGTFVCAVAGVDPAQKVTTIMAPGSIPEGSVLLVLDVMKHITVVEPVFNANGTVSVTLPALCQVAVATK